MADETPTFKSLGLCDLLVEAVAEMKWEAPTPIQVEAIPHALEGKDLIGLSQTGSGKTAAFALPILQALIESPNPHPFFACVLSPTRELAVQIAQHFQGLGSMLGVKTATIIGGVDKVNEAISLAKRPHIIVATPGRLLDHLSNTKGFSLRTLKFLVLDEADSLLQDEFEKSVDAILSVLPPGGERRTYLFSATMTKKVKKLQRASLRNPVKIELASKYSTVDTLKQQFCLIPAKYKDFYLVYILTQNCQYTTMVFTAKCDETRFLALMLQNLGIRAIAISGRMSQSQRLGALNMFKAGQANVLICTDLASRGWDIPSVDMVINYNIPQNSKVYIHRVGRTARAGRSGLSISLVTEYEAVDFLRIEALIGKKLPDISSEIGEEALQFGERVKEATRLAASRTREESRGKKRKGGRKDGEDGYIEQYLRKCKNI